MRSAMQAAAASMRMARAKGGSSQLMASLHGEEIGIDGPDMRDQVENAILKARYSQWDKLPPRMAQDLMESRREGVTGEYRDMVEAYFKAIAERLRNQQGANGQ